VLCGNVRRLRQRKGFMERANLKNRKAIFEICSLLFSFWRRSRRIRTRIHVNFEKKIHMAAGIFTILSSIHGLVFPEMPGVLEIKLYKRMSDKDFFAFCSANPELQIEQDKNGKLIIMAPVGFDGGMYEDEVYGELRNWRKQAGKGKSLSPSTGFKLPDGSTHSADGAWVSDDKVAALTPEQRKKFALVVPDFVIEIRSASDRISRLKKKMTEVWIKNGVRLAWLIDPVDEKAYVYRLNGTTDTITNFNHVLSGEDVCEGFQLDLSKIKP
jgi:Uma2 family endonuclease